MLNSLVPPVIVGTIFITIYKLFELFVRRNERLAIIEKLGDKFDADKLPSFKIGASFSSLKAGCLMTGIGLGLLVGYFIDINTTSSSWDRYHEVSGVIYGSSILLFGGISLLIAFILELKLAQKDEKK